MVGNSFGQLFRISTFGESHGAGVGVVIDGCPPGLPLAEADLQAELDRRRPGQSAITTPRDEKDRAQIISGVFEGVTTGTPIAIIVFNEDARPTDYSELKKVYRPSHADFTYEAKYGRRDWRGSGRASARETLARVAAGAIAQKLLRQRYGVECLSFVEQVETINGDYDVSGLTRAAIDANVIRCPDEAIAKQMIARIEEARDDGDSLGGVIRGVVRGVPVGVGEPVFDKLPAVLGHGMLSINAVKGFEIGSGFAGTTQRGSVHNDPFVTDEDGTIRTRHNRAGGTLGGISTGEDLVFRVAFKPTATIQKKQQTVDTEGESVELAASGRHDPCVLPRAVPIVDAMSALVVLDLLLRHRSPIADSSD